ncbi:MAG: hypothetical protein ACKV2Q_36395 [Planctomycetaceae bacterium]
MAMKAVCERCDSAKAVEKVTLKSGDAIVVEADVCAKCRRRAFDRVRAAFAPPVKRKSGDGENGTE